MEGDCCGLAPRGKRILALSFPPHPCSLVLASMRGQKHLARGVVNDQKMWTPCRAMCAAVPPAS